MATVLIIATHLFLHAFVHAGTNPEVLRYNTAPGSLSIVVSSYSACANHSQDVTLTAYVTGIAVTDQIGTIVWYDGPGGNVLGSGPTLTVAVTQSSSFSAVLDYTGGSNLVSNGAFSSFPFVGNTTTGLDIDVDVFHGASNYSYLVDEWGIAPNDLPVDHTTNQLTPTTNLYLLFPTAPGSNLTGVYWSQSGIAVTPGKRYAFSFFGMDLNGFNPPIMDTRINGTSIGTGLSFSGVKVWSQYYNVCTANAAVAQWSIPQRLPAAFLFLLRLFRTRSCVLKAGVFPCLEWVALPIFPSPNYHR